MKPLLFLDLDGVLNGDSRRHSRVHHVSIPAEELAVNDFTISCAPGTTLDLTVRLDPVYPSRLATLAQAFELVWATTWEHCANTYVAPLLGLDPLPVVELSLEPVTPDDLRSDNPTYWKFRALCRYAPDRPFAFVDDQAQRLARATPPRDAPTLVLATPYGLTKEHEDKLLAFAASLVDSH